MRKPKQPERAKFGADFKWGVSTAAFQTEGAHDADGKGPSIWDTFTATKGKIKDGHHAMTACDFYRNPSVDIGLLRSLHIPNFRFSLSWSRIMPEGIGRVNPKGLAHYDRILDELLEAGIDPWATLYHWDLPQALETKGGWTNRDVVGWFSDYIEVCAKHFGDRIPYWMVMNEPSVFTGAGYFLGIHAPGRKGISSFLAAMHHATLATAEGGRVLKSLVDGEVGSTFSCTYVEPVSISEKNNAAAKRVDALLNRAFIEPLLGMGYPEAELPILKRLGKYWQPGDDEKMIFDFDFIGLQCYTRELVKSDIFTPYINARQIPAAKRGVPVTEMGWEIYPEALYNMIKRFNAYPGVKKIIVTENGAAFPDIIADGQISDEQRAAYLSDHISEVLRAKEDGCKVDGYFVWTLTDNFEWAEGYHPRFGLIHVDFDTQKRTVKQSGRWYADFLNPQRT